MSWLDDITETLSSGLDIAGEVVTTTWETAKDAGEWTWDHREEIGDAVEIVKDVIDWIPDDTFDY
ncbi:hypothetical protein [Succinimonas sp.]|uniref:hypothetical protein n=1 Tax=Succinimonas sp. TaxID=1936151 RepID=UPI00386F3184